MVQGLFIATFSRNTEIIKVLEKPLVIMQRQNDGRLVTCFIGEELQ